MKDDHLTQANSEIDLFSLIYEKATVLETRDLRTLCSDPDVILALESSDITLDDLISLSKTNSADAAMDSAQWAIWCSLRDFII